MQIYIPRFFKSKESHFRGAKEPQVADPWSNKVFCLLHNQTKRLTQLVKTHLLGLGFFVASCEYSTTAAAYFRDSSPCTATPPGCFETKDRFMRNDSPRRCNVASTSRDHSIAVEVCCSLSAFLRI